MRGVGLVDLILNIPIELRLVALFLGGVLVGGQLNRGIYRLAWNRRAIGPWSLPQRDVPVRRWTDRLPLIGWWGLRREARWHGRGYWLRPLLIELSTGIGFALLYWLEVDRLILWPSLPGAPTVDMAVVHAQYLSHIVLISLMIVATFIDFDEQTIPDEITVTGTVIGLVFAIAMPYASLPTLFESGLHGTTLHHMVLTSSTTAARWAEGLGGPISWPVALDGLLGLVVGLLGIWGWCFAILHKTWTLRQGWGRAVRYMLASILRHTTWRVPGLLIIGLSAATAATWAWDAGGVRWQSLLTAIVGMCFGGGLIWAVRMIAGHAMQVEAMGFGDVTLMAMIGAFLGWQAAMLVFFIAPLTAVLIAAAQRLLTGDRAIAFGPYLCLAALIVIVAWDSIWTHWALPMFSLGWFIPGVLACCLVMMGGLLWLWRIVRDAIFG